MDRPLDERGAVVERDDLHPRREPGCQLRDPLLDPVDHVDRADAVTGDDDAPDGFISALEQGADAEGVADLHVRHLTDEDWHTPLGAHHDLLDVLDALDQPEAADHGPGAACLDDVAADVAIAPHHGIDDGRERNLECAKAIGIDVDLVLLDHAADARHLSHAGHGVELVADEPVLNGAKVAERLALAFHRVPEDVAHARRVRPEGGHDARWKRFRQQLEPFEHPRTGKVEVDPVLENHVDHREAERGRGAHHAHAGKPLQADRQRIRDLVLDLLRRSARPVGKHDHLVVGKIGDGVDRRGQERPVPPGADEQKEGDHDEAIPQRDLDQPVDHVLLSRLSATVRALPDRCLRV